jgi:hypothetical protein
MQKSNIYPLVIPPGCGYPQLVPGRARTKSWLPYGRRVPPIWSLGISDSYFERRSKPAKARVIEQYREPSSYPRRDDLLPTPTNGEF